MNKVKSFRIIFPKYSFHPTTTLTMIKAILFPQPVQTLVKILISPLTQGGCIKTQNIYQPIDPEGCMKAPTPSRLQTLRKKTEERKSK